MNFVTPAAARHRLRARLLMLGVSGTLLASGLTAVSTSPAAAIGLPKMTMLFVDDINGNVTEYDTAKGDKVGTIFAGIPEGIAVAPDGEDVYIADDIQGFIDGVDPENNTTISSIRACYMPWNDSLDTTTGMLWVTCRGGQDQQSQTIDAINTNKVPYTVAASILLPSTPSTVQADPANNFVYVEDGSGIQVIETLNNSLTGTLSAPAGSLALSPNGQWLYDAYGNTIYVIDTDVNIVTSTIKVPGGAGPTAVCSSGQTLYTSGSVTSEINLPNNTVVKTFPQTGGLILNSTCTTMFLENTYAVTGVSTSTGAVTGTYTGQGELINEAVANVPQRYYIPLNPITLPVQPIMNPVTPLYELH